MKSCQSPLQPGLFSISVLKLELASHRCYIVSLTHRENSTHVLSVPAANSDTICLLQSFTSSRRSRSETAVSSISALMDVCLTGCCLSSSSSSAVCLLSCVQAPVSLWGTETSVYSSFLLLHNVLLSVHGRTWGGARSPGCVASRGRHHCCVRLWNKDESIIWRYTVCVYVCVCVFSVEAYRLYCMWFIVSALKPLSKCHHFMLMLRHRIMWEVHFRF